MIELPYGGTVYTVATSEELLAICCTNQTSISWYVGSTMLDEVAKQLNMNSSDLTFAKVDIPYAETLAKIADVPIIYAAMRF